MFSYEWHSQEAVLNTYFQCHMMNVSIWFDVMGSMQGNMNIAMANAIENVSTVVVFLTRRYEQSINCRLELNYAAKLGKPIIFIIMPDYSVNDMAEWIREIVGPSPQVYPDCEATKEGATAEAAVAAGDKSGEEGSKYLLLRFGEQLIRNMPFTHILCTAVRRILQQYTHQLPKQPSRSTSPSIYLQSKRFRDFINNKIAEASVSGDGSDGLLVKCSRCQANYNPNVPSDGQCRNHSAYFMGGELIAPKWVCCGETSQDGPGCQPCAHTTATRMWQQDPDYGTFTWSPS